MNKKTLIIGGTGIIGAGIFLFRKILSKFALMLFETVILRALQKIIPTKLLKI